MINRVFLLFIIIGFYSPAHTQEIAIPDTASAASGAGPRSGTGSAQTAFPSAPFPSAAPFPSPEEFINEVAHTIVDSSFSKYYLIAGGDSCRFVKYDYEEWAKYHLQEPVPFSILNELSEKAYLSRYPYFWKQPHLQKALCITRRQADSIFSFTRPASNDPSLSKRQRKKEYQERIRRWHDLPPQDKIVFSFSLPQFTDDGAYAVIDLNLICGYTCGSGFTCLFRHTSKGWRLIGKSANWTS